MAGKNGGKRKSKKSKAPSSQNGSSSVPPHTRLLVHLLAEPEFYEAVSALDRPFSVSDHEQDGKPGLFASVDGLGAFESVLTWFATGTEEDATAKLELLPDLSKDDRASLHRLVVSKFQDKLETYSQGIGPERHITICKKGSAPNRQLTPEQEQQVLVLFPLARDNGLQFSRDEIAECIFEDKMPGDLANLWETAGKRHWAAQQLCQAAALGNIPTLQALAAENAEVLKASVREPQQGRLPLQCAATAGQVEALRVLHAAGADLEAADGSGATPLQAARKAEQCDAEAVLLQLGAVDPDADVMPVAAPAPAPAQEAPAAAESQPQQSQQAEASAAAEPEPTTAEPKPSAAAPAPTAEAQAAQPVAAGAQETDAAGVQEPEAATVEAQAADPVAEPAAAEAYGVDAAAADAQSGHAVEAVVHEPEAEGQQAEAEMAEAQKQEEVAEVQQPQVEGERAVPEAAAAAAAGPAEDQQAGTPPPPLREVQEDSEVEAVQEAVAPQQVPAAATREAPAAAPQAQGAGEKEGVVSASKTGAALAADVAQPVTGVIEKLGHGVGEVLSGRVEPLQQLTMLQVGGAVVAVVGGALLLRRWLRMK